MARSSQAPTTGFCRARRLDEMGAELGKGKGEQTLLEVSISLDGRFSYQSSRALSAELWALMIYLVAIDPSLAIQRTKLS